MRIIAVLAVALLAGCSGGLGNLALPTLGGAAGQQAVLGGTFMVVGPPGFCTDRRAGQASRGFAVLGDCRVLGAGEGAARPAVITVQVGGEASAIVTGREEELLQLLETNSSAVLRDGATVVSSEVRPGAVLLLVDGPVPESLGSLQSTRWRGIADVGGRLVTITVYGLSGAPLAADAGRTLLIQSLDALAQNNSP